MRMKQISLAILAIAAACSAGVSLASSHREGPYITSMPKLDGTDLYMFRSYETGRQNFVTILANYQPFQDPQGGPNFYMFDPNALYEIHIDNNGDGVEDLTFQFQFKNNTKGSFLNIGGKSVKIPLINSGQISNLNDPKLDVRETFTLNLVRGARRGGTTSAVTNVNGGVATFDKPVDNIGAKTFPQGYVNYANQHMYSVNIPGCSSQGRVFVGQRKEPFFIAVGKIFDLFNLDPLGPENGGNNNDLEGKNISTLALELPIDCITTAGEPVIGAFTTSSVRQTRIVSGSPSTGLGTASREGGPWTQVSRVGMPLVNEVVIGTVDKDKFNASRPKDDAAKFADYVTNPVLPALIETLFPSAKAPTNFPRTDLVNVFLKGISGLNQSKNAATAPLAEMLRLNTSIAPTAPGAQNVLGVAGGDLAGFPNGRRPADDVVDVSLRVAMGALCVLTGAADQFKLGCKPSDAPAGALALTDGVRKSPASFFASFPYLTTPLPGNLNPAPAVGTVTTP